MKNIGFVLLTMLCATAAYAGDTIEPTSVSTPIKSKPK